MVSVNEVLGGVVHPHVEGAESIPCLALVCPELDFFGTILGEN